VNITVTQPPSHFLVLPQECNARWDGKQRSKSHPVVSGHFLQHFHAPCWSANLTPIWHIFQQLGHDVGAYRVQTASAVLSNIQTNQPLLITAFIFTVNANQDQQGIQNHEV